uniref:Uncharacterized protein n=1 Tax=Lactuca sativa TaxID=4236 RepID=A0A9R1XAA7_LACSA|nr:hypothetical protein LSAT_V11C500295850 [Lactuca sativa]
MFFCVFDPKKLENTETVIKISCSIIHLIDEQQNIELASGEVEIIHLRQGTTYSVFLVRGVKSSVSSTVVVDNGGFAEAKAVAYRTTLAQNVEDYNGFVAGMIVVGTGQLMKGILWGGDVTIDQLKWGNEFLKKGMKIQEGVATEILSSVVKDLDSSQVLS